MIVKLFIGETCFSRAIFFEFWGKSINHLNIFEKFNFPSIQDRWAFVNRIGCGQNKI